MFKLILWAGFIVLMIGGVYNAVSFSTDGENIIITININGVKKSGEDGLATSKELISNIQVNTNSTQQN